jgi:hypothetical protein
MFVSRHATSLQEHRLTYSIIALFCSNDASLELLPCVHDSWHFKILTYQPKSLDLCARGSTNALANRNEETASLDLAVRAAGALEHRRVDTLEGTVGPRARLP